MRSHLVVAQAVLLMIAVGCASDGTEQETETPPADTDDGAAACESAIVVQEGTSSVVPLDACAFDVCISVAGDTPYCSKQCGGDEDCGDFRCEEIVTFGPMACADYEDPLQPRAGSSNATCAADADCAPPETCFTSTCGLPGRDCLTGPNGAKSTSPLLYCVAR